MSFLTKTKLNVVIFGGLLVSMAIWLLFVAAGAYSLFYWLYVPSGVLRTSLNVDFDQQHHLAVINLPELPLSSVDYSIALELDLPRNSVNRNAGNFYANVALLDAAPAQLHNVKQWSVLAASAPLSMTRSAILPYKSDIIEVMETLLYAPFYVFGFMQQTSIIDIDFMSRVTVPKRHYKHAVVQLQGPLIQWQSASLVWKVRLTGIRGLMHSYPILSFLLGTSFIWFWELVVAFAFTLYLISGKSNDSEKESSSPSRTDPNFEAKWQQARRATNTRGTIGQRRSASAYTSGQFSRPRSRAGSVRSLNSARSTGSPRKRTSSRPGPELVELERLPTPEGTSDSGDSSSSSSESEYNTSAIVPEIGHTSGSAVRPSDTSFTDTEQSVETANTTVGSQSINDASANTGFYWGTPDTSDSLRPTGPGPSEPVNGQTATESPQGLFSRLRSDLRSPSTSPRRNREARRNEDLS